MFRSTFFVALILASLTSSLFAAEGWETNYAKALEMAKAQNKRVLLDFTGSDWCPPCMALRKQVFSRPEFRAFAEKNLILVELDYPQRKKQSPELKSQNEKLSSQYGIDEKGFPTVVLIDPSGKVLRQFTGYDGESVAAIVAWIEGKGKM